MHLKSNTQLPARPGKRTLAFLVCLVSLFVLCFTSCSTVMDDEQFLKNLRTGLEKRWDKSDNAGASQAALKELVEFETNAVGAYEDYTFESKELADLAKQYCDALQNQLDGLQYLGSDDTKYNEVFHVAGYQERAKVLFKLSKDFDFTVGDQYSSSYNELVQNGEKALKLETVIEVLSSSVTSEMSLEAVGNYQYDLLVENKTESDLDNVAIEINGYEDDVIVTTGVGYIQKWKSGEKNRLTIYFDKDFTSVKASISFDDYNGYQGKTDYLDITFENALVIDIVPPALPMEINYSIGDMLFSTCRVDSITSEPLYWNNGKASVLLKFSGEKLYDMEGADYSGSCQIGWKLYDVEGQVVDSGSCYTSNVKEGESFKDDESYISTELIPGEYRLELLNIV